MVSPATSSVNGFTALLRPVADDNPAGPDPHARGQTANARVKELFDAARKARDAAYADARRARSHQSGGDSPPPRPDWAAARDRARAALEASKDVQLALWLTEASVRLDGFAGLADGLELLAELYAQFGQQLHPPADKQLRPLNAYFNAGGSTAVLMEALPAAPLFPRVNVPAGYYDIVAAQAKDLNALAREVAALPAGTVRASAAAIARCLAALGACDGQFGARFGANAPTVQSVREFLQNAEALLGRLPGATAAQRAPAPIPAPAPALAAGAATPAPTAAIAGAVVGPAAVTATVTAAAPAEPTGPYPGREDALVALAQIGQYFTDAEPHSPLGPLIEQAVRWGRMSLSAVLAEVIPDSGRDDVFRRLGLPIPTKAG